MNIGIIGTGYVGLTHGTCLAELGNNVFCVDIDENKIDSLKKGIIPIFEPKLSDLVLRNFKEKRLKFTTNIKESINNSDIIFIAVGTPAGIDGHADMKYIKAVANSIGEYINGYKIIVTKSTVPVGTGDMIEEIIRKKIKERGFEIDFDIASNPEFLKEGTAVDDFFNGDRIVIGCNNKNNKALEKLEELYSSLKETKILKTDLYTSEIIKYGANSFLAMEISFINILSQLCEKVGADITKVSEGLKLDSRIGKKAFLNAGAGFGGSCFPKDVIEFSQTFKDYGIRNGLLESTININERQKETIFEKIKKLIPNLEGKTIGILGLAFKPDTDDIRYSPAITVIEKLLEEKAKIKAFDPKAINNLKNFYPDLTYTNNFYETIEDTDCFIIITDWNEFKQPNWEKVLMLVKQKNIVDGRNIYEKEKIEKLGFNYIGVGR